MTKNDIINIAQNADNLIQVISNIKNSVLSNSLLNTQ